MKTQTKRGKALAAVLNLALWPTSLGCTNDGPNTNDDDVGESDESESGGSDTETGEDTTETGEDTTETGGDTTETGGDDPLPAIGLIQYDGDIHFGDAETNLANLTDWTLEAVAQGARIVVLPEGSIFGYASDTELWCAPGEVTYMGLACRDVATVAELLPGGPITEYWAEIAATHDIYIVYSVPEVDGDIYYASVGVVGPEGFVTRYRKRALYHIDYAYAEPGDESVVLQTPYGDFGLMICLDGSYNGEYYDLYNEAGVDAIILSMDWDDDPEGPAAASTWFADRATDNGITIYAADVSKWDGTAKYLPNETRQRNGLPADAVGIDGLSIHPF